MKVIFKSFIYNLIHPFKAQKFYYLRRNGLDAQVSTQRRPVRLRISEVILISWLMAFFTALYSIGGMKLGISFYVPKSFEGIISFQKIGQITIYKILFAFVFYPIGTWIWLKIVGGLMKFTALSIGSDEDVEQGMKDVLAGAMTPSVFFLLPIVGVGITNLLFWVYCGIGLVKNLRFSVLQALVILVSPLALFILLIGFIILVGVTSLNFV